MKGASINHPAGCDAVPSIVQIALTKWDITVRIFSILSRYAFKKFLYRFEAGAVLIPGSAMLRGAKWARGSRGFPG